MNNSRSEFGAANNHAPKGDGVDAGRAMWTRTQRPRIWGPQLGVVDRRDEVTDFLKALSDGRQQLAGIFSEGEIAEIVEAFGVNILYQMTLRGLPHTLAGARRRAELKGDGLALFPKIFSLNFRQRAALIESAERVWLDKMNHGCSVRETCRRIGLQLAEESEV